QSALAEMPPRKPKRLLVLGAGMSGLTAALALHRRGHDVQVLEYQNRIGGRLISIPLKDGQFTEGGGGHFRTNMPLVCGYINHFKLPLISMNDGCPRFHVGGQTGDANLTAPWPWELQPRERNVSLPSLLATYLVRSGINLNTVLEPSWPDAATLERLDNLTLKSLLQSTGASEAFIRLVDAYAAEATVDTAVLALLPDFAYHFADRNLFRIAGGNDRLPRAMAAVLGPRVHLGMPAVSIRQTASQATVVTKDGREWAADAVVSTIPFPVLRDMEIVPKLLPRKQELVDKLQWSPVVKVYVQNRTAPWLRSGVHGWPMAASDRPWERVIDITGNEPGGHGNIFFYLTGKNAESFLQRPKETRPMEVVNQFQADLPGLLDEVITIGEFSWPDQPWIKAAFADLPLGAGWMIEEWQIPEGRLHFAGDFTTLKSGWVEGAIESGLRAARQIDPGAQPEFDIQIHKI
ncbi:MAG: amino acid oxidase, partial [Planctomyces sp.]|nr:amino acid oxidase [Planctomyces sp.]